ncbi:MAG: hypothetical protein WCF90_10545 [Methanomicrobiales archaeon]
MGIEIVSYDAGTAVIKMQVWPDMIKGVDWLRGWKLVALTDEAIALALYTVLIEQEEIATVSESTRFVKRVRD